MSNMGEAAMFNRQFAMERLEPRQMLTQFADVVIEYNPGRGAADPT